MRQRFYHLAQGTEIIPYQWFLYLEQVFSEKLFRAEENLCRYKIIPDQKDDTYNPDGLPVGFAKTVDTDHPIIQEWLGFTCAACHTGQLEFGKTRIIIDGGQAMWDVRAFGKAMLQALGTTLKDEKKFTRFADRVLEQDFRGKDLIEKPESQKRRIELMTLKAKGKLTPDLAIELREVFGKRKADEKRKVQLRKKLQAHVIAYLGTKLFEQKRNEENAVFPTEWGFGRNDALGRGGNKVLTQLHSDNLRLANAPMSFPKIWDAPKYKWVQWNASIRQPLGRNIGEAIGVGARLTPGLFNLETGCQSVLGRGGNKVLTQLHSDNLRLANAPMSFPKIWDAPKYKWVQWNASIRQPLGRNIGEAIGVGARLTPGLFNLETGLLGTDPTLCWDTFNWATGKGTIDSRKCKVGISTSVNLKNMVSLEHYVRQLTSPQWPADLLGTIDEELRAEGEKLYKGLGDTIEERERNLHVKCIKCHVQSSSDEYQLREIPIQVVGTDGTAVHNFNARRVDVPMLGWKNVSAAWATQELTNVIIGTLCSGEMKPYCDEHHMEMTQGRKNLWRSPLVYMAGTNIGVWATAPYLHNGSIPNLYQLLSPREERFQTFCVGNLEFDPTRVGFVASKPPCAPFAEFEFDTRKTGNSNSGHEFRDGPRGNGVIGRLLTPRERFAIIEYLKALQSSHNTE